MVLSQNYEDAMDQLHYLLQAKLITHDTVFFQYTERDPADGNSLFIYFFISILTLNSIGE